MHLNILPLTQYKLQLWACLLGLLWAESGLSFLFQGLSSCVGYYKLEQGFQMYDYWCESGKRFDLFGLIYSVCISTMHTFFGTMFSLTSGLLCCCRFPREGLLAVEYIPISFFRLRRPFLFTVPAWESQGFPSFL